MAERDLIEYIRTLVAAEEPDWLEVGIGDDAALIETPDGGRLVLTTDMLVEGVHFEPGTPPELTGRKAVARALSDLAAMASRPLCMLAAIHLRAGLEEEAHRSLVRAMVEWGREWSAPLVGGDVGSGPGPLSLTVTALGTPGPLGVVCRHGARPGDAVCVTGRLGGSLRGRHLSFTPRLEEALQLAGRCDLHAMIDVSDGLSTDALHVAEASGRGISVRSADVPISEDARAVARETGRDALWHALNDGEDYELLFCLRPSQADSLVSEGLGGTQVSVIGEVTEGPRSWLILPEGRREPLLSGGWEHEL